MTSAGIPPFRPHRLVPGGHAQTLVAHLFPGPQQPHRAFQKVVRLPDGDSVAVHDDCPPGWSTGDPVTVLVHGLSGCHRSSYMVRIARKLTERGIRTYRMDLRGCGAGRDIAQHPYHAGRSADLLVAVEFVTALHPDSPLDIVGFSLGGALLLKMLGELPDDLPSNLRKAMAVSPPIDLAACVDAIGHWSARMYNRVFLQHLEEQIPSGIDYLEHVARGRSAARPRNLREFDEVFTAPIAGFNDADDYYTRCSALPFVEKIRLPTLVLAARDDPLVPVSIYDGLPSPSCVHVHIAEGGGHLGFLARRGTDADRRWMDWRVIDWLTGAEQSAPLSISRPA